MNEYIEHTLLKADATKKEVENLLEEAVKYKFLGVCVNPCNVAFARQYLNETGGNSVKVVTVIGFPLGQNSPEIKMLETIDAVPVAFQNKNGVRTDNKSGRNSHGSVFAVDTVLHN